MTDEAPAWMTPDRYPVTAVETPDARGARLRSHRRSLGLDIAAAAKQLRIPAPKLVLIETGRARFTDPADYARAAQTLRNKSAQAARSGPSQPSTELSNLSAAGEAMPGSTPGGGTTETSNDSERKET